MGKRQRGVDRREKTEGRYIGGKHTRDGWKEIQGNRQRETYIEAVAERRGGGKQTERNRQRDGGT
jgi:hypothetical protein